MTLVKVLKMAARYDMFNVYFEDLWRALCRRNCKRYGQFCLAKFGKLKLMDNSLIHEEMAVGPLHGGGSRDRV